MAVSGLRHALHRKKCVCLEFLVIVTARKGILMEAGGQTVKKCFCLGVYHEQHTMIKTLNPDGF